MTFNFKELARSPVEVFQADGMKAERRLLCAYEDRYQVVASLWGGGLEGVAAQGAYPNFPGVVAVRVRIEPFEKRPDDQGTFDNLAEDQNSYSGQLVEIVVDYELLEAGQSYPPEMPEVPAGTLLTYRMDFSTESLDLPEHALKWASDGTVPVSPEAAPTIRVPIIEHQLTWHRVIAPPWAAIRQCVGTVNQAYVLGAAPETLLFDGAQTDRQFSGIDASQQAQFGWQISYVFLERAIKVPNAYGSPLLYGWNHAYRAEGVGAGHWDKLVDSAGVAPYAKTDFSPLFNLAAGVTP